jgi:RNA-directed DNA polymerase
VGTFTWRRVIRTLSERHPWVWKDVRRRFTTLTGRWLPITTGEIEFKRIAAIPITWSRYHGDKIPKTQGHNSPHGRHHR